jgi:hypothetical protein
VETLELGTVVLLKQVIVRDDPFSSSLCRRP